MNKQVISTDKAPGAIGPYSQGIKNGNLVFTSGQIPINPATGEMITDDIKKAAAQSLENVKAILAEAGATMEDVIKTTVYLQSMDDFAAVNEVYASYFGAECPARSCVAVAKLPKGALVEIEAIAVI